MIWNTVYFQNNNTFRFSSQSLPYISFIYSQQTQRSASPFRTNPNVSPGDRSPGGGDRIKISRHSSEVWSLSAMSMKRIKSRRRKSTWWKPHGQSPKQLHTVDGRNPANQLRLVVDPIIYRVLAPARWLFGNFPRSTSKKTQLPGDSSRDRTLSPNVGGSLNLHKGSLNHPKKVTMNCQVPLLSTESWVFFKTGSLQCHGLNF